ncbi:hypothetical protein J0695_20395 [Streptomyces beijiangensis]|uniref:Uncharacterized protein n=1 Tax=Streptomyces beijiangensis TaxID=163361 RepID=A0A939JFH5_9ACTN|nr:hypothetical protein [Streptomyces beijiangensis]MBO0514141.1 hypothetical protein [Streptomyces beijiangensis]
MGCATALLRALVGIRGLDLWLAEKHLGPHRLPVRPVRHTPAETQRCDEYQATSAFVVAARETWVRGWQSIGTGIGEFDTKESRTVRIHGEVKLEVPAGGAAVSDRIGREFSDDEGGDVGPVPPGGQMTCGIDPGKVGAPAGRAEEPSELPLCVWHLLVHGTSIEV